MKKSEFKNLIKEEMKKVLKENQEINVDDLPPDRTTSDEKLSKRIDLFWKKQRYRVDEDKRKILEKILGYNFKLWSLASRYGVKWDTVKQEEIESGWENDTPGYVGKMSGDLRVKYKGSVELGDGKTYYKIYTISIDTRGFW